MTQNLAPSQVGHNGQNAVNLVEVVLGPGEESVQ